VGSTATSRLGVNGNSNRDGHSQVQDALMLGLILSAFDPISRIVKAIADAKVNLANAQTDQEKIHAQERVDTLSARRDVLVSESGSRVNAYIRAGFALPFVIYNAKLILWDKVLALGSTDPLSPELFQVEIACIGFYFLYDIAARWKR
jgi:hypothetical protein